MSAAVNVVHLHERTPRVDPVVQVVPYDDRRKIKYLSRQFRVRLDDVTYMTLNAAARGVLESLEDQAAARGLLPTEPATLAMLARLAEGDVKDALPRLQDGGYFVFCSDGREMYSPTIEAAVQAGVDRLRKQSAGGTKGAERRYGEQQRKDGKDGLPMGRPIGSSSSSSSSVCKDLSENIKEQGGVPMLSRDCDAAPPCPAEDILAAYHEHLPMLPKAQRMTAARREKVDARWREVWLRHAAKNGWTTATQALEHSFVEFFKFVLNCPFLIGGVTSPGRHPFTADFDWLMEEEKFWAVREGKYSQRIP